MTKGEKGLIYPIYRGIIKTELWAKRTKWSTQSWKCYSSVWSKPKRRTTDINSCKNFWATRI